MNVQHLKVGTRLYGGFGVILLLTMLIAAFGIFGLQRSNASLHHLADVNVAKIELLNQLNESIHITNRVMRTIALLNDDREAATQAEKIGAADKAYRQAFDTLRQMPLDQAGQNFVHNISASADGANNANQQFMTLMKSDREGAIRQLLGSVIPLNTHWQTELREFSDLQQSKNHADETAAQAAYQDSLWAMLIISVVSVVAGAALASWITLSIQRQLGGEPSYTADVTNEIAQGNLAIQISMRDSTGNSLLNSVARMRDSLAQIVEKVRYSTDSIGVGISEISTGNADLSARTESQASTLEETAASVEELASTVKQNADNAAQASSLADHARELVEQGGAAVEDVVKTMSSINESSRKVVDIISVIDTIAFQTNILALNAAVEAARAGEQGRGFAVVATEVRTLAQHSANAAKEIKTLIDASVEEVTLGTRKVDQAGDIMKKLVESVRRVNQLIADIAVANREQASGIEQVNQAVTQMDEATQQNAALVEQATAAAQAMEDQMRDLSELVGTFRLDPSTRTLQSAAQPQIATRRPPAQRVAHIARAAKPGLQH